MHKKNVLQMSLPGFFQDLGHQQPECVDSLWLEYDSVERKKR